jgi:PIN domain nuclease of toxin-antitoxin system
VILQAGLDTGFVELPMRSDAAVRVAGLPPHHRDLFDRLLVAQAIHEPVRLYTADPCCCPIPNWPSVLASGTA